MMRICLLLNLFQKSKIPDSGMDPDTDSDIVDQDKYSDYNYTEPFIRLDLGVWFHPPRHSESQ